MINYLDICIQPDSTIEAAMKVIGRGGVKIALVMDNNNRLLGTLNDGDIRRALLKGKILDDKIDDVYHSNAIFTNKDPSREELVSLCSQNKISQIPIVDKSNQIIGLFVLDELLTKRRHNNTVVLMVGGLGTRLRPLTEDTPKPMLKVGEMPILQTIIDGFSKHGFTNFTMCLGYKSDVIKDYFQDGKKFGVNIEYVIEDKRMGTAGALTLLQKKLDEPFFVMNGDILTNVNYDQLLDFHKSNNAKVTMCVREYDIEVPYGVINMQNESITSIEEKPVHSFFVNAGIYLLEPKCIDLIPNNEFYDMPTLCEKLLDLNEKISPYPLQEFWLDIGRMVDYEKANKEYSTFFNR
jgi:dTDP-glucose pyrophosphorylase